MSLCAPGQPVLRMAPRPSGRPPGSHCRRGGRERGHIRPSWVVGVPACNAPGTPVVWAPTRGPPLPPDWAGSLARAQLFAARRPSLLLSTLPGGLDHESPALPWGQGSSLAHPGLGGRTLAKWGPDPACSLGQVGVGGRGIALLLGPGPAPGHLHHGPRAVTSSVTPHQLSLQPWAGHGDCASSGQALPRVALSQAAQLSASQGGRFPAPADQEEPGQLLAHTEAGLCDREPPAGHRASQGTVRVGVGGQQGEERPVEVRGAWWGQDRHPQSHTSPWGSGEQLPTLLSWPCPHQARPGPAISLGLSFPIWHHVGPIK